MEREKLGTRLGFILLSAGCAIGCGNVWKFPTMTGANGGGAFVLLYLVFLALLGLPVLAIEYTLGRASKTSPVLLYGKLTPNKKPWKLHGYAELCGNVILMMFYITVAAWMGIYFILTATGKLSAVTCMEETQKTFAETSENPLIMIISVAVVVFIGFFVCSFKLDKGLEKVTKYMMLCLLLLILVIAIYAMTLSGAGEGLKFYLVPDFTKIDFSVIVGAMNQAFFTLSIGIGAMAIFGSYINDDRSLVGEAATVISLDTFVAVFAGLIIFPSCYTYGVDADGGPSLIFQTLPLVFANLPFGRFFGSLFFLFMTFAALSTVFAVFENIVACIKDLTGKSRVVTCVISGIAMFILSLPCVLSFTTFGTGFLVLNIEDFAVSNVLLPVGSALYVLYCGHKFGWGWDNFIEEVNKGKGLKFPQKLKFYVKYILPALIIAIMVIGLVTFDYKGSFSV